VKKIVYNLLWDTFVLIQMCLFLTNFYSAELSNIDSEIKLRNFKNGLYTAVFLQFVAQFYYGVRSIYPHCRSPPIFEFDFHEKFKFKKSGGYK